MYGSVFLFLASVGYAVVGWTICGLNELYQKLPDRSNTQPTIFVLVYLGNKTNGFNLYNFLIFFSESCSLQISHTVIITECKSSSPEFQATKRKMYVCTSSSPKLQRKEEHKNPLWQQGCNQPEEHHSKQLVLNVLPAEQYRMWLPVDKDPQNSHNCLSIILLN